jgi:hypothetical protein
MDDTTIVCYWPWVAWRCMEAVEVAVVVVVVVGC